MTPEKRELTDRESKLLTVLREAGDWVSRKQLGALMGNRKKLPLNDVYVLRRLQNKGLIEIRQHKRGGPTHTMYEYKAK